MRFEPGRIKTPWIKHLFLFTIFGFLIGSFNLILWFYDWWAGLKYDLIFNWRISPRPVFSFLLVSTLFYFPVTLLQGVWKKTYLLVLLPVILLNIACCWYVIFYQSSFDLDVCTVILRTNPGELSGFLRLHWTLFLSLFIGLVAYRYWFRSVVNDAFEINKLVPVSIIGVMLIVSFLLGPSNETSLYYEVKNRYFPFASYGLFKDYYDALAFKKKQTEANQNFTFNATKIESSETEVYVFFIGESARGDHFQINGYPLPTTPNLSQQKNLLSFTHAAAQASHTMRALPLMLTRATPSNYNRSFEEKSIVSAHKEVGFKTVWLSSLPGYVFFDEMNYDDSRSFESEISKSCPYITCDDALLLDYFDETLASIQDGDKIFIVLHGYGSHNPYDERVPTSFQKFQPKDDSFHEEIIASYDNSILYTDHIIGEVIKKLNQLDAKSYLLYTSDHGDNLGDDTRELYYHSLMPSSYASDIPLFVWYNNRFAMTEPTKVAQLDAHRTDPVSNDNVFQTLCELSGISYPDFEFSKSLCNSQFKGNPQEIFVDDKTVLTLDELKAIEAPFRIK